MPSFLKNNLTVGPFGYAPWNAKVWDLVPGSSSTFFLFFIFSDWRISFDKLP